MSKPYRKKLIEVALPLEAINEASAREKSIRHGHPSTLHLWWARRPLAAARAVIFAQMVDDPSEYVGELVGPGTDSRRVAEREWKKHVQAWAALPEDARAGKPEPTLEAVAIEIERRRLFRLIEELVQWENTTNESVLQEAREEIWRSWRRTCAENADHPQAKELFDRDKLPGFHDPFAGGGALPLEAQRLGLESYASDLNPVAVLINKAMIEIPPKFANQPPVNPDAQARRHLSTWKGAQGLAEDVRYYGQWMRDEAEKRIGHLYPKVDVVREPDGTYRHATEEDVRAGRPRSQLTVIAWLWARTVKSPNPAFRDVDVPLASTFMLSTKAGKEAYVEPVIDPGSEGVPPSYRFTVKIGKPKDPEAARNGTKLARGANFRCLMSGAPIAGDYIKAEGQAGRMGARLMAIVAEGERGRVYLAPRPEHEATARQAKPEWRPEVTISGSTQYLGVKPYGMDRFDQLFTDRQLVALTTFSDLVGEAMARVKADYLGARASGPHPADGTFGSPLTNTRTSSGPHDADETSASPAQASRPHSPTGWYSRGYHPHFDQPGLVQSITFRLHDSVPDELLQRWRAELGLLVEAQGHGEDVRSGGPRTQERETELRKHIDKYEDAGHGACHLRRPEIATVVEEALLHFDGERYRLLEWCIMPNHVHVVVETVPGHALGDVVQSWKSFTAKKANEVLGRTGTFWMADYSDRFVRDENHLAAVRRYVRENPVKAGLCDRAEEWRFGSAWRGERAGGPRTQDDVPLRDGGAGATAYAEAVGVYLACGISKAVNMWSSLCSWMNDRGAMRETYARQALAMVWDYAEANPFSSSGGNFNHFLDKVAMAVDTVPANSSGRVMPADAAAQVLSAGKCVSTDPPYYDNIGYADLSDFFYVWLRRSLRNVYPDLFATIAVPKAEELVATPYRHGSEEKAEAFFLGGMTQAMHRLAEQAHPAFPVTIYYAFKQQEAREEKREEGPTLDPGSRSSLLSPHSSTGWETFLEAVIRSGFALTGTWPMRTEMLTRQGAIGTNALASSIVLVCRRRDALAPSVTRREFLTALQKELPKAISDLQRGSVAPVDLQQAAIGPGMAVFTRYAQVLDADGKPLRVRDALAMINQALDEILAEQEGDFDRDTRWALAWFEQFGFSEGDYGVAETLSKAKNTSVGGIVEAGIATSGRGKVRLLKPEELPADWTPEGDQRLTVWDMVHHLIRVLEQGEGQAAELMARLGSEAETARELAYRLYAVCDRTRRSQDAQRYNALVQSWPEIAQMAQQQRAVEPQQSFEGME